MHFLMTVLNILRQKAVITKYLMSMVFGKIVKQRNWHLSSKLVIFNFPEQHNLSCVFGAFKPCCKLSHVFSKLFFFSLSFSLYFGENCELRIKYCQLDSVLRSKK